MTIGRNIARHSLVRLNRIQTGYGRFKSDMNQTISVIVALQARPHTIYCQRVSSRQLQWRLGHVEHCRRQLASRPKNNPESNARRSWRYISVQLLKCMKSSTISSIFAFTSLHCHVLHHFIQLPQFVNFHIAMSCFFWCTLSHVASDITPLPGTDYPFAVWCTMLHSTHYYFTATHGFII